MTSADKIANAAAFFDGLVNQCAMMDKDRKEAKKHVKNLHDEAAILAEQQCDLSVTADAARRVA